MNKQLPPEDINAIKMLYEDNQSVSALAKFFGVTEASIENIVIPEIPIFKAKAHKALKFDDLLPSALNDLI